MAKCTKVWCGSTATGVLMVHLTSQRTATSKQCYDSRMAESLSAVTFIPPRQISVDDNCFGFIQTVHSITLFPLSIHQPTLWPCNLMERSSWAGHLLTFWASRVS